MTKDGIEYVLTEHFNQDPVEILFGQQRSRGCRNDNPSVLQFIQNTRALTVQKSLALGGSSIISTKNDPLSLSPLSRPLPDAKESFKKKINKQILSTMNTTNTFLS